MKPKRLPVRNKIPASDPLAGAMTMDSLLRSLRHMRADLLSINDRFAQVVERLHPTYRDSARNLLGYLSLRRHDIRDIQDTLAGLGLSSMGRAEAHVLATLNSVIRTVCSLARRPWIEHPSLKVQITRERGRQILREHTEALLGQAPAGRSTRIMVTMPSEAAGDYGLVKSLLSHGMNCMRINCAHDDETAWQAMIDNLRRAQRETGMACRVLMDLSGPKLRTGPLAAGPKVVKWRPKRDAFGRVTAPARIWLRAIDGQEPALADLDAVLAVDDKWLSRI
ncbi:MAG TPA: pyruvate kinase, partial [Chitinivibrionales bacterium]|nr:pyruvate kinase [Chitinivibrionales bacterium]